MNLRNEKEAVDVAFQALLSDANEEFAMLLREMGTVLGSASLGVHNRSVSELLMRAVRCAAKQYMLQTELGSLAITDELTGLYNRRGFVAIADRQLKLAHRCGKGMLLFFVDLNGLKQINDSFGHGEGNRALKRTAEALMKTFRDSDVIARMGGDEFAVLAIEASGQGEATIRDRLRRYLKSKGAEDSRYSISVSLGSARYDPSKNMSLEELLALADSSMYEEKRAKSARSYNSEPIFTANGTNESS